VSHCLAGVAAASRQTSLGLKQPLQVCPAQIICQWLLKPTACCCSLLLMDVCACKPAEWCHHWLVHPSYERLYLCLQISAGQVEGASRGRLPPAALAGAAETTMATSVRPTFAAVGQCEAIVTVTQRHFHSDVAPHLLQVCRPGQRHCSL
jgi:hypothetical protein